MKTSDTSFADAYFTVFGANIKKIVGYLKNIVAATANAKAVETQKTTAALMEEMFNSMNKSINSMVDYKYTSNRGWMYVTKNPMYALTHGSIVIIEICLFNGRSVKAQVVVFKNQVCDIKEATKAKDAYIPASPAAAPTRETASAPTPVPVSNSASPVRPVEEQTPKTSISEDSETAQKAVPETSTNEDDEKKAISIADNFLADEYNVIEILANNAISNGVSSFLYSPDIYGGPLVLQKMAELLVEKLKYKSAAVNGQSLSIEVNLDVPADDGNYDFDEILSAPDNNDDHDISNAGNSNQQELIPAPKSDADAGFDISGIVVAEDVPDDIDIPEAPKDFLPGE